MRNIMLDESSFQEIVFFEDQFRQLNISESFSLTKLDSNRIAEADILIISDFEILNSLEIFDVPVILSCSSSLTLSKINHLPKPFFIFTDFSADEFKDALASALRFNQFSMNSDSKNSVLNGVSVRTIMKNMEQSSVETSLLNSKIESNLVKIASSIQTLYKKSNEEVCKLEEIWIGLTSTILSIRNFSLNFIGNSNSRKVSFNEYFEESLGLYKQLSNSPLNFVLSSGTSSNSFDFNVSHNIISSILFFLIALEDYFNRDLPVEVLIDKNQEFDDSFILKIVGNSSKDLRKLKESAESILKNKIKSIRINGANPVSIILEFNKTHMNIANQKLVKENISYSIAIVDDEPIIRNALESLLEESGLELRSFKSSEELLEYLDSFKENPFSLYLLDIIMPGMTGDYLYSELTRMYGNVKALFLSGYSVEGNVQKALEDGASGFLSKPVRKIKLYEHISKLLGIDINSKNRAHNRYGVSMVDKKQVIIDKEYGIRMVDNNEELYYKICDDLLSKYNDCIDVIQEFISDNELEKGKIYAHSLKSIVGMVGGFNFQEKCKNLEYSFKNKNLESIKSSFEEFKIVKHDFFNALELITPKNKSNDIIKLEPDFTPTQNFISELKHLESFLIHSEINEANNEIDRLTDNLDNDEELNFLKSIRYNLDNFDIDEALNKLSKLVVE